MTYDPTAAITQWLARWRAGDKDAEAELVAVIYPVLLSMSRRLLHDNPAVALSPAELVHECYLRLAQHGGEPYASRTHFYAIAATVIRCVLIDEWRERRASKRGGDLEQITLSAVEALESDAPGDVGLIDLDRVLVRLAKVSARTARLVELRFFAGMTIEEAAEAIEVSVPTATREWRFAREWLQAHLDGSRQPT